MSRSSGNILDYYVDLKDREATLVGLRWLNSKQVKLERSIQRQAAIDLLAHGPLEPLQLEGCYLLCLRQASCGKTVVSNALLIS